MSTQFLRYFLSRFLFLFAAMGAMTAQCYAQVDIQGFRVAYIDGQRVLNESLPAKMATAKIEQEFLKRTKELDELNDKLRVLARKLDKEAPSLSEMERLKRQREINDLDLDFNRKQRIFNEDLGQRKQEERAILSERTQKVVRAIAEAEKIDLVIEEAFYFNPRIDITDKVIKALAK